MTGKCDCKPQVEGDKCDRCATGFYDLEKGCLRMYIILITIFINFVNVKIFFLNNLEYYIVEV